MRIKKKLPLMISMLVYIPLLVLAFIIYEYSSNALVSRSKQNLKQLATTQGKVLEELIDVKEYQVQMLASDERVIDVLASKGAYDTENDRYIELKELLNQVAFNEEDCYEVCAINSAGQIIVSSNKGQDIGKGVSYEAFQEVLKGENVIKTMVLNKEVKDIIDITVPVKDENGKIIGAICKGVLNKCFRDFVSEISIDKTGYTYILDDKAMIIAHPSTSRIGKSVEDGRLRDIVSSNANADIVDGTVIQSKENNMEQYVALYKVSKLNWIIGVAQSTKEVDTSVTGEFAVIIVTIIGLGLGVIILTITISKHITDPIDKLIEVMGVVSKGRLDKYCDYHGKDELGALAKHYNKMIKSLSESRQEREQMLQELTVTQDDLKNKIGELVKSKEALSISEERYRTTLDDIEETIWEHNMITKEFIIIGKWKKYIEEHSNLQKHGEKKLNFMGIDAFREIIEEENMERFREVIVNCTKGKITKFSEEVILNGLGWGLCKGKVVFNEQGEVIKIRGILTDITSYKMSEEKVKKLAYFDVLTGCLNKQAFMVRLEEHMNKMCLDKDAALFFVDLDDFKKINDTMGHEVGDNLLNYVADKIKTLICGDVVISRFGGDEFVIYKSSMSDIKEIKNIARKILNIFKERIIINDHVIHITCSIGIALYPLDGTDCKILLKNADTAMYRAKEQGKNSYSFYDEDMSKVLTRKLVVESALREAVGGIEGLYLQYQPIVEIESGKTVGAEALIRLKTDQLGYISPGEFIPIAEETGLIISVGDWAMRKAIDTLSYYRQQGYEKFSININVSAVQIQNRDFMKKLKNYIRQVGISPECIKIEVTETVLMQNLESSRVIFEEIKEMGIKLALDDFGTGYSSLNYLRNIPLDVLKIDKSFIDEVTVSAELSEIVDSIINMAHTLGILVVAEGVETKEQLELLKHKGCDLIQGYVFSKPLMQEELAMRLLEEKIG